MEPTTVETNKSKRKTTKRLAGSTESLELAASTKGNHTKRAQSPQYSDFEPIEISSDEEVSSGTGKEKSCIASRTRSKAHNPSPLPHKRHKHISNSIGNEPNTATKLGSNIRKTSNRQHNVDSGSTSANTTTGSSRRTPINIITATTTASTSASASASGSGSIVANQNDSSISNHNANNSHLRRSSRSKGKQSSSTTGSCISSAASTSQACTTSASSGTFKRQSSHMANDGSRDTSAHHQSQNHYGNATKQLKIKLHRMTFTTASISNSTTASTFSQINLNSNSNSSTSSSTSTEMPNIHSLRRSPRGSVKTNSLSTSASVHASPLAQNASTSGISIAATK